MTSDSDRLPKIAGCIACAGLLLLCGWLIPIHLRALDTSVLERASLGHPSLLERGIAFEHGNNPDAARLILKAAQSANLPDTAPLESAIASHPQTDELFPGGPTVPASTPVIPALVKAENREATLAFLKNAGSPAVQELLRARDLTNTVLFPPSASASGQAIDSAISLTGLLMARDHLTSGLRDAVLQRATSAANGASPQPLEEILMDLMSLGERLDWGQLVAFVNTINTPQTLNQLAVQARNADTRMPQLFAAVVVSQNPEGVSAYLDQFSETGLRDLTTSLRYGQGGVDVLLQRRQLLRVTTLQASAPVGWYVRLMAGCALRTPTFALMLKWFFFIVSGFLLASAGHLAWPTPAIEEPLRVRGFHVIRESLFALGFVLVVLLLCEPFLAQNSQKAPFAFRLRLPVAGAKATGIVPLIKTKLMDTRSLITLAVFFVLQGLIYCTCLAKLAEIRRQKVVPRVQLKLLENEEHLFDAGLYLGFAGTIICLILVSLGVIQQSLMAAYSSTSFGIIFVSIFKIFNLRPVRRRLLMESEQQNPTTARVVSTEPTLVATP